MQTSQSVEARNNVKICGSGSTIIMLAHGFGCDQKMWRHLLPYLDDKYTVILFDYVGCGASDFAAYDKVRYSSLTGYAQDVLEICEALNLTKVNFIGHSVSSMIGMHAAIQSPDTFSKLTMICPSPCFLNFPPDYEGGFEKEDLEELINLMDKNYVGWANYLAPLVMGQDSDASLTQELETSFCSTDPKYAKPFAKATFFADDRALLSKLTLPTLILQSKHDNLASTAVGNYMNQMVPNAQLEIVDAHGHCLHMTNPLIVSSIVQEFVS